MTVENMQASLYRWAIDLNHKYFCSNTYCASGGLGWGESDFLSITRAGLITECEIKRSRSDFKADFKKKQKHELLAKRKNSPVQYFYYVCPEGIIDVKDLPPYAGLIHVFASQGSAINRLCIPKVIVYAPKLNKAHATEELKIRMLVSLQHKYFKSLSPYLKQK